MSGDQEFEDFLKRRRPLFRRDVDDGLEPPAELDRIVLRQARDAIEGERPMRLFGMPRWAAPVAIAATLVLGLSVVLKTGMEPSDRIPEVRVENIAREVRVEGIAPEVRVEGIAQRIDPSDAQVATPPAVAPAPAPPNAPAASDAVVVDLASPPVMATASAPARAGEAAAAWRRDARSWQAEIERLRASGDTARADAELAEFNRQYRAYAVSPDR
jgi:hypothetical protein